MIHKNPYLMGIVAAVAVFGITTASLSLSVIGLSANTVPSDIKNSWLSFGGPSTGPAIFSGVTIPQAVQQMEKSTHENVQLAMVNNPYLASAVPIKIGTLTLAKAIEQMNYYQQTGPNTGSGIIALSGGELVNPFGGIHSVSFHHFDIPANSWLDFN